MLNCYGETRGHDRQDTACDQNMNDNLCIRIVQI